MHFTHYLGNMKYVLFFPITKKSKSKYWRDETVQMNGSCGRICSSTCTIFGLVLILFVVKDLSYKNVFLVSCAMYLLHVFSHQIS